MNPARILSPLAYLVILTAFASHAAGQSEPVVARVEMKLTLNKEVLDVIEKGDLLTVLSERETSYVIQTFNGVKGAVAKTNVIALEESSVVYDELLEQNPDEGRLYTLRASAHWAAGDAQKALADFDQAIELGYDESHAFISRGLFHASAGQFEKAIKDYTAALERDAEAEVPYINRAAAYTSLGRYAEAIEDYTQALRLRPENPVLFSQRAVVRKLAGQLDLAIIDYDKALELSPEDVAALMGRGFLRFQLGDHQQAIVDFTKVIEVSPESAVAFNNRGFNHKQLNKHAEAAQDFKRAVELAPNYLLALQNLGWLQATCPDETLREPAEAIETATRVCEISQYEDFSDLVLLAASYAAASEFESAIGWQEKAIEIAVGPQQQIARRILEHYHLDQPLDLRLLDDEFERPPSPLTTRPKR